MTRTAQRRAPAGDDAAPQYRVFLTVVARTQRVGPSFVRLTLAGEQLQDFGASGDDQRIKFLLPQPGHRVEDIPAGPDWYADWRSTPDERRPFMRTYTVRAARPAAGELDIDVVLHGLGNGHAGPAAVWAAAARPGDPVALIGPDRPGRGRAWGSEWGPPPSARWLLLAGDETAVPAVGAILEGLPPGVPVTACLEVPDPGDRQSWHLPADVSVRWSFRNQQPGVIHGELLIQCVRDVISANRGRHREILGQEMEDVDVDTDVLWDIPDQRAGRGSLIETYAWLAGEAGVIRALRRHLVTDLGIRRDAVAFMGYWRLGRSESN